MGHWHPAGQGHLCQVWRGKQGQVPTLILLNTDSRSQLLASAGFHLVKTFNLEGALLYMLWQAVCWLCIPDGVSEAHCKGFWLEICRGKCVMGF